MTKCPHCKHSHRTEEQIEKCKARAEKRVAREEARKADERRREKNRKKMPEERFITDAMGRGLQWDRIVSTLNKDYPIPEEGKWTLWRMVEVDSVNLLKTWNRESDAIVELRLQKHYVGDYLSRTTGGRDLSEEIEAVAS